MGCYKEDSSDWISSDGTFIYINNNKVMLTSFDGTNGIYEVEGDPITLIYKKCVAHIRDCPENRQDVHEADLSTYKKSSYFDAFINTFSVMHIPLDDISSKEVTISTKDKDIKSLESVRSDAYNTLNEIKFEPIKSATFNEVVTINGNGNNLIVRNTNITIPGILTVFKGTRDVTQQVEINGVTCSLYQSNNFNFYQYGENLIKIGKDFNVEEYITLKSLN